MPAGVFLSNSTRDLFHSGLGHHVSGTSKSLAELSEMLPSGKGQHKMSKEGEQHLEENGMTSSGQGSSTAITGKSPQTGLVHGGSCPWSAVSSKQSDTRDTSQVGLMRCLPPALAASVCFTGVNMRADAYHTFWWHTHTPNSLLATMPGTCSSERSHTMV